MTSGKRVQLPPAPELTDGSDLLLRLPRVGDVDDIVAQCRDPEFQRWTTIPVPYNEADAHEFLRRVEEGWQANVAVLAIAYRERFSGSVDLRFDGVGGAEVGFGLAPWARGNGVMTRALRLVLAWGFGIPGIQVVYWRAQVGNWPSRRVATRCGFRMEGTVRGLLEQRGERRDGWIGSLRRGEPLTGTVEEPAQGR
ncbi:MAG: GNAT family N-acetyltransferase [Mycobacterium sp.]|uniref:GNAT family N-acetyltransferase n=1 Tax=Mycobacterium sp. TaxID=1785 RepID=UPI003C49E6A4